MYRSLSNFHDPPSGGPSYNDQVTGIPRYDGIEYDYEVSGGNVVSSPGGVSSTQHHWTKGFYGSGGVTSDIYGGQGNRYPYGPLGNIYNRGYDAATEMGNYQRPPDFMPSVNDTQPIDDVDWKRENYEPISSTTPLDSPSDTGVSVTETTPIPENFTSDVPLASVSPPPHKYREFIVIALVLVGYLALNAWSQTFNSALQTYVFHDRKPTTKNLLIIAIVFTVVALACAWWFRIEFIKVL